MLVRQSNFEIEHNFPWTNTANLRWKALQNFPTQRKRLQFNTQRQQHAGSNNGRRNNLELLEPSLPTRL